MIQKKSSLYFSKLLSVHHKINLRSGYEETIHKNLAIVPYDLDKYHFDFDTTYVIMQMPYHKAMDDGRSP